MINFLEMIAEVFGIKSLKREAELADIGATYIAMEATKTPKRKPTKKAPAKKAVRKKSAAKKRTR